jgi:hypothetical protein
MKRILFIVVMLTLAFSVFADVIDLAWESPDISSQSYSSILQEKTEPIEVSHYSTKMKDKSKSYFTLQDWSTLKTALTEYLTSSSKESSFINLNMKAQKKFTLASLSSDGSQIYPGKEKKMKELSGSLKYGFDFKLVTGFDYFSNSDENYNFQYYGIKLNGYIEDKIFFYTNFWAGHFNGDEDYILSSPMIDSWTQRSDDSTQVFLDNVSGKLLYQIKPYWSVSVGRGKYEIGNNIGGSIILDDECNDYGYFATKFDFPKFYVHFMHASLIADSTLAGYKDYPDKYLATHKFGWKPNRNLEIFWGEHVLYGNRGIDVSYLVPFTYWRGTEHNLSDRDNVLIFGGVNFRPFKRNILYFNSIFDEFSKSDIFGNWWGNKYAFQLGNSYQFSSEKQNRITLEFTAIRPWLYTHKYIQSKFSNDDIGLGYPLGSNLLNYAMELNWEVKRNLTFNLHGSYTRQGSVGNDFSINYEPIDPELENNTHWLEGDITDYIRAKFILDWKPLSHHRIRLGVSALQIEQEDIEHELSISYQTSY